jgi:hypothetical protein
MRRIFTPVVVAYLLLVAATYNAEAQDLRLEISVPKRSIKTRESVSLTVRMVNTSSRSYYVAGNMSLGNFGLGYQYGWYTLQYLRAGSREFVNGPQAALDGFPRRNPTISDIIADNSLVLLEGNTYSGMFIGTTINSTWDGLTLLPPGRYSIRVTFNTYGERSVVPEGIRYPIFLTPLVSNVIDLEIQP